MRPADELTLYAYGLLEESEEEGLESHLKTCATCGESVRLLKIEHRVVTQAAARGETPAVPAPFPSVRPSRYGAPLLVAGLAAAALLGILVWLLLHPFRGGDGSGGAGYAQGSGDDLDRLIAELKSPSTVRREIAELALRAHGRGAVEKLENAKADPALIEACRGITREDAATLKKLMETRITLDLENTPLPALLDQMREISQLNFNLSGIPNADEERVSFKVNDIVLDGALRLLLHPRGCAYRVKNGAVLVTTEALAKTLDGSTAPAQNPVRFAVEEEVVARAAAALSSESPEERDRASESLVRLGFAAEPALWKALDSPRAEERGRASDLLRQLYSTLERPPRSGTARTLRESKVDLAFENARYSDILAFLGQRLQIPIVGVTPLDLNLKTTVVIKDLIAENSLKLILSQTGQNYLLVDGMILIADSGQRLIRTPVRPLWASPEEARRQEAVVRKIATEELPDARRACTPEDLGALLQASRALRGAASERCRRAAALLAEEAGAWLVDQPSGAELQSLSEAQAKILRTQASPAENEMLGTLLGRHGLKLILKAGQDGPIHAWGAPLPLSSLLKVLTRPGGLDYYMDGSSIVIDTLAHVRARIEK